MSKKSELFNIALDKLTNDTDFLKVVKSAQEQDIFKNIFFNDNQLNLFDFISEKPITIEDTPDFIAKNNNKNVSLRRTIFSEKDQLTRLSVSELKRKKKKQNKENFDDDEKYEDLIRFLNLEEALSKVSERKEKNPIDYNLLKKLNLKLKDVRDFYEGTNLAAGKNLKDYKFILEEI